MNVKINEVVTEMIVTDGVGPLSPEEVRKIVGIVLEQVRREQDRVSQRGQDTEIHDRVFRPEHRGY